MATPPNTLGVSQSNMNQFLAEIRRRGVLKSNRYKVTIPMPPGFTSMPVVGESNRNYDITNISQLQDTQRSLEFWTDQCSLPAVALAMNDSRRYGIGPSEKKPFVPVFNDVDIIFRVDGDGKIWDFFTSWINMIICFQYGHNGFNSAVGPIPDQHPYEIGYMEDYAVDIKIDTYDDSSNRHIGINDVSQPIVKELPPPISVTLREAFPIYIGELPLNWAARGDFARIPVKFSFFDWFSNGPISTSRQNVGVNNDVAVHPVQPGRIVGGLPDKFPTLFGRNPDGSVPQA